MNMKRKNYVIWIVSLLMIGMVFGTFSIKTVKAQGTIVSGLIESDTIWDSSGSPYIIVSDVTLMDDYTLTVLPKTEVQFYDQTLFTIRGHLSIEGSSDEHAVFKSYSSQGREAYRGIHIDTEVGGSAIVQFAEFYNAQSAINIDCAGSGPCDVYDSIFKNNNVALDGYGGWDMNVNRCTFENNTYAVTRADKIINESIFINNDYALYHTERISVYDSIFSGNGVGLWGGRGNLKESFIYGNGIGVKAFYQGFTMSNNNITMNNIGVIAGSYGGGSPPINYNNIYDNNQYNVGTTDTDVIDLYIYDIYDDHNLGKVFYDPFLTSPIQFDSEIPNLPPVAYAQPDMQTVNVGEQVWFSGNGSYDPDGDIVSYEWNFGDGSAGYGVTVTHTYNNPGNYTVILTVTDDDGATDSCAVIVIVEDGQSPENQPPVAFAEPEHQHVDVGEEAWFSGNGSYDPDGYIVSYHWNFGDGNSGSGETTSHVYQLPGNYTVTLTVTDNEGATDTDTVNVQVFDNETHNQPPVAYAYPEHQIIDTGEEAWFTGNSSYDPDGYIVSYEWDFGDGTSGSGVNVTHTYNSPGNYTITLTVTDNEGATDSDSVTVTVLGGGQNQPPVADADPEHQHVDVGEKAWFWGNDSYDPDGYIVSYHWHFGDGTTATGELVTHVYQYPGNYTVTLTVTDNEGATDMDYVNVRVFGNQTQNMPPVACAYPEHQIIDSGEEAWFTGNSSYDPDGYIVSYQWYFGDGATGSGVTVTHTYNSSGNYTVTLTVTDNEGAQDSDTIFVTVSESESDNWSPVADAGEDRFATPYETLTFYGNGSFDFDGAIVSYSWDFGDGAKASGMIVTHSFTQSRTYIVTLSVVDDEGATDTETCIIFMIDEVPIMFPEKEYENDTLPQPKVIPEIESEKQTPEIINKQKPILIITAGLINIATFDEEIERIVPVEVTAYYGDVSNVRIELIDDGGLEIDIIPIVQDVPSGEIVRFYLVIKEPESYVEDEGKGITIKLKAVSEDTESNIEHVDVVITKKITESPLISEVEIISTAGTISIVALLAILVKRRFL
jgi:PKD repeat protein